jgi:hypothetical protein
VNDVLEPIVDEGVEAAAWEAWSGGPTPRRVGATRWGAFDVLAGALAFAAAILPIAAIIETFRFDGVGVRDRAFIASLDGATVLTAALALAAVGVVFGVGTERRPGRWALVGSSIVSMVVMSGALYRAGYVVLVHPNANDSDVPNTAALRAAQATYSWPVRMQVLLVAVACAALACAALYVASRAVSSPAVDDASTP